MIAMTDEIKTSAPVTIYALQRLGTVDFPNSAEIVLPLFVSTTTRLFYIRSKIFLQIGILWILLFQMIYCSSFISHIFIVKIAVYEKELQILQAATTGFDLA